MKKYTSFWEFLSDTPRNVISIYIICGMASLGIIVSYQTREDFDPYVLEGVIVFLSFIIFLAILRVWLIYRKNK